MKKLLKDLQRKLEGFTLTELLMATTISLIAVAGGVLIVRSGYEKFYYLQDVSRTQQQVRFALERMTKEIRESALGTIEPDPYTIDSENPSNIISFASARDDNSDFLIDDDGKPDWANALVYIREPLLFNIGLEFQNELNNGNISTDLRQEFSGNDITLSQNATVSIVEADSQWLINDRDNRQYSVIKEEGELNIYAKNALYRYREAKTDWDTNYYVSEFDSSIVSDRELMATSVTGLEFWTSGNNLLNIKIVYLHASQQGESELTASVRLRNRLSIY